MGDFNPRQAALHHAGEASRAAMRADEGQVSAEAATAVACGLVYVGDVLEEIRRQLWNANESKGVHGVRTGD